jgi:hypothetical protein
VALNLEYLIQLGASCELVAFYGWPNVDVEVEVGEFDALAHGGDRVVLAMEAKARIDGPDSLSGLWRSFVDFAASDSAPAPLGNHARKYVELLRLTESGPVVVWLVAAQARWVARARRVGSHIDFEPFATVDRGAVIDEIVPRSVEPPDRQAAVAASVGFALDVARLTELDGQQRCYEFPWTDRDGLDAFIIELRELIRSSGLAHVRAWKWRAESSGGLPLSPSGRATGLELRCSYYP